MGHSTYLTHHQNCKWKILQTRVKVVAIYIHKLTAHYYYSEKPNKMQQRIKILLSPILNEAQHVSGYTPPIIRSLRLHKQPLVLYTWKVVGHVVAGHCQVAYATTTAFHVCKTRGCLCSFRLLMMGGVLPETCWASYKYGIINFDTLLHLVGFFCTNH